MALPALHIVHIGREAEPVVVIDDFASDPNGLRAIAARLHFAADDLDYPGIKAAVTRAYFDGVHDQIADACMAAFGYSGGADLIGAWYQLVTTPPAALSPVQRIPHFDAIEPGRIAMLHYLSDDDQGGTAFYRHRATGFETIDAARVGPYLADCRRVLARSGAPPPAYIDGDTPDFERTAAFASRFNRVLIYRSALLHSGVIPARCTLSPDPLRGRLTVASFLAVK